MSLPHWLRHRWGKWYVGPASYTGILVKYGLAAETRDVQYRQCEVCGLLRIKPL